jgi:hypothetical protein
MEFVGAALGSIIAAKAAPTKSFHFLAMISDEKRRKAKNEKFTFSLAPLAGSYYLSIT